MLDLVWTKSSRVYIQLLDLYDNSNHSVISNPVIETLNSYLSLDISCFVYEEDLNSNISITKIGLFWQVDAITSSVSLINQFQWKITPDHFHNSWSFRAYWKGRLTSAWSHFHFAMILSLPILYMKFKVNEISYNYLVDERSGFRYKSWGLQEFEAARSTSNSTAPELLAAPDKV